MSENAVAEMEKKTTVCIIAGYHTIYFGWSNCVSSMSPTVLLSVGRFFFCDWAKAVTYILVTIISK